MEKRKYTTIIDSRTGEDIKKNITKLAAGYVPEWQFDEANADIGSALGLVFASEMEHNIDRYNQVLYKYHTEFVNMLDISLLPAKPSHSVILLSTPQTTMPGRSVKRGTKFITEDPDGEESYLVFESDHDIYVTGASITDIFMTDRVKGGIIPLYGDFHEETLVPDYLYREDDEETEDSGSAIESLMDVFLNAVSETPGFDQLSGSTPANIGPASTIKPFFLFGEGTGIEKNALLFTHPTLFDITDNPIFVRIRGNSELIEGIVKGDFRFLYPGPERLMEFDTVELMEDGETLRLVRYGEEKKLNSVIDEDKKTSLIILNAENNIQNTCKVDSIMFSSNGKPAAPESVSADTRDASTSSFAPFGEVLSLYQECYIGHDDYFSKGGAKVRLEFDTVYYTRKVSLTAIEEEVQLKIIKRAPQNIANDSFADCYAQEVVFEYYNGNGWKQLPLRGDHASIFASDQMGHYVVEFDCPQDWEPLGVGAYEGRSLRITLIRSENCYIRPCIHHFPVVRNMQISFSYEEKYINSRETTAIRGTRRASLTKAVRLGKGYEAFVPSIYGDSALYLGFTKKPEEGPVSILFMIEESLRYEDVDVAFEYSTSRGFRRMRVIDFTHNMSKSGMVLFMPPSDMAQCILEGKKRYWIRLVRPRGVRLSKAMGDLLPKITDIQLNAVMVSNINTLPEQDFYIDEVTPFAKFPLGVNNILNAEVWVNEMGRHSRETMRGLLMDEPEHYRAEYNNQGEVSAFYCLYSEKDRLDADDERRCYMLDRMNNIISFGDGITNEIPRVMDNVAFRVTLRTCSGEKGNVPVGAIQESMQDISYVEVLGNPVMSFGGSDIESLDSALLRGANILSSRRRLVSTRDYVNEIYAFSDSIVKAACITGERVDGSYDKDSLSFVILLKNHEAGSFVFHDLAMNLQDHLLKSCECTVSAEDIHIVEPVFVEISVDIWAESTGLADSFSLEEKLRDTMDRYLDPVGNEGLNNREIGVLPQIAQIQLNLNVLKSRISIKKIMITAKYTDTKGTHETDYAKLKKTPFMVCKSGAHRIHLTDRYSDQISS